MKYVLSKILTLVLGSIILISNAKADEDFTIQVLPEKTAGQCYCNDHDQSFEFEAKNNEECFELQKGSVSCVLHIHNDKTYSFGKHANELIEMGETNIDFDS